jgi:phosphoserine phosphatase
LPVKARLLKLEKEHGKPSVIYGDLLDGESKEDAVSRLIKEYGLSESDECVIHIYIE